MPLCLVHVAPPICAMDGAALSTYAGRLRLVIEYPASFHEGDAAGAARGVGCGQCRFAVGTAAFAGIL